MQCYKALGTWVQALPDWSVKTLRGHASDQRDVKSVEQLERGETGDLIWDALQHQLNVTGGTLCSISSMSQVKIPSEDLKGRLKGLLKRNPSE